MAAASAAILGGSVILLCVDVGLRNVGFGTLKAAVEITEYGLYAATLLCAPWVLQKRAHVAVDLLPALLGKKSRRLLEICVCMAGAGISAVCFWYGMRAVIASARINSFVWKTLVFPEWWLLLLVPASMAMMGVGFLRLLFEVLRGRSLTGVRGH